MSDQGLNRRVTRLENDTESLYDLLTEVRSTQDEHTGRLDQVDTRLEQVDARLDRIDTTLTEHTATLGEILRRLPEPS
ncbi:hypothetical protein [Nocardioides sp.]|uniref:hypothetical protein n=1 Tax=Nocardioides sp. TaxID=35761 RepID=UPI0037833EB1